MTMFDYAQSNSLLKKQIEDRPAKKGSPPRASSASSASPYAAPAAAAPAVSKKIPRSKLDGSDDNDGIQEEGPPLKKQARNDSRDIINSSQASKNASADTDTSAMATISVAKSVSAATTASPVSASVASSTTSKKKEEKIPAKQIVHAKDKLADDAAAAAEKPSTAAATAPAAIQNQSKSQSETATSLSGITTVGLSGSDDPAQTDVAKKPRKSRIRKPRRLIPNEKEYIPADEQPTQSDVVGGRGGRSNHHPGNRPYWIRILESRIEYTRSRSDHEKARIANGILRYVQEDLIGRFLNNDSKTKRWYILPNSVVLDKIKQALRDKYIPFWARDLKIENKKHETGDSIVGTEEVVTGNNTSIHSIDNNCMTHLPLNQLNSMLAMGSSFAGMQNPHMVDHAVTLAAIKANANAFNFARATAAAAAATPTPQTSNKKTTNKLDFLFGSSARRPMGRTADIPSIDDILKRKVDQMPSFDGFTNARLMAAAMANASAHRIPSIGMNPYQPSLPSAWMTSVGLGGMAGTSSLLSDAATNHGFGAGGNPGAPALSPAAMGLPSLGGPSLGVLRDLNMRSLDKFLDEKMAGRSTTTLGSQAFATTAANFPSLSRYNALAGTSFDSVNPHGHAANLAAALAPTAAAPTGSNKTDWNAMYTRALTNNKTM